MFDFLKKKKVYEYSTCNEMKGLSCVYSDGSEVVYNKEDDTFYWYKTSGEHEDNYYYGTYECYRGRNAADYVIDKGIMTELASKAYYNRNRGRRFNCMDNTLVLVIKNEYMLMDGEKKMVKPDEETGISTYYGFFDGARAEMVNVITGNTQMFAVSFNAK